MSANPKRVRIDPNGNEAQRAFAEAETKETYYFGGVSSGKTTGGVMRLARHIYEWNPGETLAIITPTAPMMRNVIIPELRKWGLYDEDWHQKGAGRLEYPNETTVVLESASNLQKVERLRGLNLAGAWLDEIGQQYAETYHVIGDRLRTGNYRNLWGTGTPKGKNWAYRECVEPLLQGDSERRSVADGELLTNGDITTIFGVSTAANQSNPDDFVDSRRRQHAGHSYKQEFQGEFEDPEGLVYDWWGSEYVVADHPDDYERTVYGVDWGYNSPAAALAILDTGDGYHVAEEVYVRQATTAELARELDGMVDRWGTGPIYCDPAEPANIEEFTRNGLDARKAENDVLPGIQTVTGNRHGLTIHKQCRNLRNEFSSYEWKDNSDKPVKANDHACDCLRYAIFSDETGLEAGGGVMDL